MNIILQQPDLASFYDPAGNARIRAFWGNRDLRIEAKEGEYDCPACFNRGFFFAEKDGFLTTVDCDCKLIRKNWEAIRRSGMEMLMQQHSFENFHRDAPWQRTMAEGAMRYASEPVGWLLLCGQSGGGKTHLASAVCRHLAARHKQVQFMGWVEEAAALKALATEYEPRQSRLDKFKKAEVLFVDDVFKCGNMQHPKITDADLRLAHELLEYRSIRALPTILTTELTPDRLEQLDGALFGRLVENCAGQILTVPYDQRRNYRLNKSA